MASSVLQGETDPPSRSFQGFRGGKTERPSSNATANKSKEARPTPTVDPNWFVRRCWRWQSINHLAKDYLQGREYIGHRHDTVIVFRVHLLNVKLKVSRKLIVHVIMSCVTPIV